MKVAVNSPAYFFQETIALLGINSFLKEFLFSREAN